MSPDTALALSLGPGAIRHTNASADRLLESAVVEMHDNSCYDVDDVGNRSDDLVSYL